MTCPATLAATIRPSDRMPTYWQLRVWVDGKPVLDHVIGARTLRLIRALVDVVDDRATAWWPW